jgi:hypothetical protein
LAGDVGLDQPDGAGGSEDIVEEGASGNRYPITN